MSRILGVFKVLGDPRILPESMEHLMALPCMNCRQLVEDSAAKFFAAVFVCPDCFALAESFYKRSEQELKDLLVLQKESLRLALLQGKFRIGERRTKELSKTEVMQEIMRLHEMRVSHGK